MSEDDVLFGYRLRVLDHAARTSVSEACRVFGIHRSTYYVWRRRVERHGLEILRPRERRRPRMPQQLSPFVGERIVAFALGHPGYGPRRITIIGIASKAVGGDRRADRPQSRAGGHAHIRSRSRVPGRRRRHNAGKSHSTVDIRNRVSRRRPSLSQRSDAATAATMTLSSGMSPDAKPRSGSVEVESAGRGRAASHRSSCVIS
jgi:hypothetical protein